MYSKLRKRTETLEIQRNLIFVVRTLDMCWCEGVANEVRMMKGSEWLGALAITLKETENCKRVSTGKLIDKIAF